MNFQIGETGENVMSRVVRGHVKDPVIVLLYLHIHHLEILIVFHLPSNISLVMRNRALVSK